MKAKITILLLIATIFMQAQQVKGIYGDSNWFTNWTNFRPATTEYSNSTHILTGIISANMTLLRKNTYQLVGVVYVTNKATLTIESGTVIRGDKESCGTLVITKGSKIMAEGNETAPIVFTSNNTISDRRPGDWGGIIILGDAPINRIGGIGYLDLNLNPELSYYGGNNEDDNSGVLKYVRIEYSGRKLKALKELNGLSLAGVGRKSQFEYIQVSYSNDDSFECYGGNVNFNNVISYRATDDDFDYTQGTQSTITNSIAIRDPFSFDISGSRCFEIDSVDKIENFDPSKKLTKIEAQNMTFLNTQENVQGLVREAIYIKDKSFLSLNNSVISGFEAVVLLDSKISNITSNLTRINFQGVIANNCTEKFISEDATLNTEIMQWFNNEAFNMEYSKISNDNFFLQPVIKKYPDFRLKMQTTFANR
jgi:uncharacterized membrane protein